eukprot:COSAG01_NODE_95_length_26957_cov_48.328617_4_plen_128_part_00
MQRARSNGRMGLNEQTAARTSASVASGDNILNVLQYVCTSTTVFYIILAMRRAVASHPDDVADQRPPLHQSVQHEAVQAAPSLLEGSLGLSQIAPSCVGGRADGAASACGHVVEAAVELFEFKKFLH